MQQTYEQRQADEKAICRFCQTEQNSALFMPMTVASPTEARMHWRTVLRQD